MSDPIVDAKSVAALMQALDDVYGWKLPTAFPPGTPLADLWAIVITVQKNPSSGVLYQASATVPYAVAAILSGAVEAQVLGSTAGGVRRGFDSQSPVS